MSSPEAHPTTFDPVDLFNTLDAVRASQAAEDPTTSLNERFGSDSNALHRINFLALSQSFEVYNAMRLLITDEHYWGIEEAHYQDILHLVRDYNCSKFGANLPLEDCTCPPAGLLKSLWQARVLSCGPRDQYEAHISGRSRARVLENRVSKHARSQQRRPATPSYNSPPSTRTRSKRQNDTEIRKRGRGTRASKPP